MRLLLLLLIPLGMAFPGAQARWTAQTDDAQPVRCTSDDGGPWCRKEGVVAAPLAAVDRVLSDFAGYTRYFPRVRNIRLLAPDVVLATVDMPSPFADRQWLARFTRTQTGDKVRHSWVPAQLSGVALGDTVRLEQYAGEWLLSPVDSTHTHVRATFHADLGGDIPDWTEKMAYNTQGNEMLAQLFAAATAR